MDYPGRTIKEGERDARIVRAVQAQLMAHHCGEFGKSGTFGPRTTEAVKLFQAQHVDSAGNPLKRDGRIGALTWEALFGADAVPSVTVAVSGFLERVLAVAASQVGILEMPRNSNSGPEVDGYLKRAGVPISLPPMKKPWCCAFVYWCFDEAARAAGRDNPMPKTAGCLVHWELAGQRGTTRITGARATQDPTLIGPGAVFVLDTGGGKGHTGFVDRVEGGMIHTIEGNTDASLTREGGGVYRLRRKLADVNRGFIDYAGL